MQTCVDIALAASKTMLTVVEFIAATNYPIDTFMIDKFWNTMEQNRLIYVDDELISWMGYGANTIAHRKATFCRMLPDNHSGYHEYTNAEYKEFIECIKQQQIQNLDISKYYPPLSTCVGKGRTKHLLLEPDCLRNIMMRVNTTKGDRIRNYYIQLENLCRIYTKYQCEFNRVKYAQELEKLHLQQQEYTRRQAIIQFDKTIQKPVGCVYFIRCDKYVKIGFTYNLPARVEELQTCNPIKLQVVRSIIHEYPQYLESILHKIYAEFCVSGEWFLLSDEQIANAVIE
jgi:phage anti-repressor protein